MNQTSGFCSDHPTGSKEWHRDRRAFIKNNNPELYERNKKMASLRNKIRYKQMNSWDSLKHILILEMGRKCQECGLEYTGFNIACFDFHHEGGEKIFNISEKTRTTKDIDYIKREAKKCRLVCSNCHRLLHYYEPQKSRRILE